MTGCWMILTSVSTHPERWRTMAVPNMVADHENYQHESNRLKMLRWRERDARHKAWDMHGGDRPGPGERPMPQIITQCGTWAVTPQGVECLVHPYEIQWDSITDPLVGDDYWLEYLSKKSWVVLEDFANALHHGRRIHAFLQGVTLHE